jgi:Ca-activated chloride channel homolog
VRFTLSCRPSKRPLRFALAILSFAASVNLRAQVPFMGTGPDSAFAQIDFDEMYLDQINQKVRKTEQQKAHDRELIDSGSLSAFDLAAPNNAVEQYNHGSSLMKAQNSKDAIKFLQKAIADDPKFVSAHVALGRAYLDQEDATHARSEFEAAAKIDPKYAEPLISLGRLAMSLNDFSTAQSELEKAATLRPKDPKILTTLAFAENGNHAYTQALVTVQQVHALDHKGMANVHYVAAAAAMSLKDYAAMERELNLFLGEDPTGEYAAIARKNLTALEHNKTVLAAAIVPPGESTVAAQTTVTLANSAHLKEQLNGIGNDSDCDECNSVAEANPRPALAASGDGSGASPLSRSATGMWTIRTSVDDVTVFFSVSSHGHTIGDLQQSDIKILDDSKPPVRLMEFSPQSKLPLRLALLIDTSGSVHDRFSFEKNAATKFVEKILNQTDLAFVAGFSNEAPTVTQDFTSDVKQLGEGIHQLSNGGGTALFDAVSFACRKLAAYPETEHVARVVVILSDGEDNSSHNSLKQSIQAAERAGVTIYAISTREDRGDKTDADKVLEALADLSGGEALFPGDILTLGRSFDKLHEIIRSRYFVAYKPADFHADGSYRTINITAQRDGKRFQVRARKGYHSRIEARVN